MSLVSLAIQQRRLNGIRGNPQDHGCEDLRTLQSPCRPGYWSAIAAEFLGASPSGLNPSHPRLGGHDPGVAGVEPAVPALPPDSPLIRRCSPKWSAISTVCGETFGTGLPEARRPHRWPTVPRIAGLAEVAVDDPTVGGRSARLAAAPARPTRPPPGSCDPFSAIQSSRNAASDTDSGIS